MSERKIEKKLIIGIIAASLVLVCSAVLVFALKGDNDVS